MFEIDLMPWGAVELIVTKAIEGILGSKLLQQPGEGGIIADLIGLEARKGASSR